MFYWDRINVLPHKDTDTPMGVSLSNKVIHHCVTLQVVEFKIIVMKPMLRYTDHVRADLLCSVFQCLDFIGYALYVGIEYADCVVRWWLTVPYGNLYFGVIGFWAR